MRRSKRTMSCSQQRNARNCASKDGCKWDEANQRCFSTTAPCARHSQAQCVAPCEWRLWRPNNKTKGCYAQAKGRKSRDTSQGCGRASLCNGLSSARCKMVPGMCTWNEKDRMCDRDDAPPVRKKPKRPFGPVQETDMDVDQMGTAISDSLSDATHARVVEATGHLHRGAECMVPNHMAAGGHVCSLQRDLHRHQGGKKQTRTGSRLG